jgi:hypothetical protein
MKFISIIAFACLLAGCTAAQIQTTEQEATAAAQTAENVLETVNVATGGTITTALANYALKVTHNSGDAAIVDATIAEQTAIEKAQLAAKAAGTSGPGLQAVATALLVDPNTTTIGATAAIAVIPTASTAAVPK